MAVHHHVVRHAKAAVHHLRQRPEEDREMVAYIIAGSVVAFLFLVWMFAGYVSASFFPSSNAGLSAAAADAFSTTTPKNVATDIDGAIYVKIPGEDQQ